MYFKINMSEYNEQPDVVVDQCSPKHKKDTDSILQEYSLKKGKFDPNSTSPNEFIKKLELRMKNYYALFESSAKESNE